MGCNWRSAGAASALLLAGPMLVGAAAPAPPPPIVVIGAAYIAKQVCSCLFVVGRSEASCRAEFKPDIDPFTVAIDRAGLPASGKVTASLGPVVGEATYASRFGCVVAR
ncbi:MAG: hypothetical protein M3T55_04580 [Pseudomonadota bacterium]|nr:hypothetical protein [Pseudomonadota bacterium]